MDILVVGGGTATNSILSVFPEISRQISYVVPISDNGGSTSEVLRILGGPAIGDARSRLVRLIPESPLKELLGLRLPDDPESASHHWTAIVEGRHELWQDISPHIKDMYRAFLIKVHGEILLRNRPGNEFQFCKASVGNLLLSGARIFFGSLDAAIEFVLSTARVPQNYSVLPALNSNFTHHIAAQLRDGTIMVGQTQISHPAVEAEHPESKFRNTLVVDYEDATMPFSHPSLSASQISFTKDTNEPLSSPIKRLFYVNPMGVEIKPKPSRRVLEAASRSQVIVYSVGSLFTSILPIILLQGFSRKVAHMKAKIFMLNGTIDRETTGLSAYDHIRALVAASLYSQGIDESLVDAYDWTQFVTHIIYPIQSCSCDNAVEFRSDQIEHRGITCVPCLVDADQAYELSDLNRAMRGIISQIDVVTRPPSTVRFISESP